MGDMADNDNGFNDLKSVLREQSIRKRHHNRESSPQVLDRYGVEYESHNGGIHLIVTGNGMIVDFWPGTGKWIVRDSVKSSGRGVFRLIEWLGIKGNG